MLAVKTSVFEGPLDLLLHLIEREDLDITAVSLIQVTDQYMAALRVEAQGPGDEGGRRSSDQPAQGPGDEGGRRSSDQPGIDLRALADFVAVGAKLLFLKSRALLPRTAEQMEADDLEAEEIAQDLTAQLEEYRAFKAAASYLRELDDAGHRSFARIAPPPADWLPTGLENITLKKLLAALSNALERLPAETPPQRLSRPIMNLSERRQQVLGIVQRRGQLAFAHLIADCRTRFEAIITFLAVLELLKTEELSAEQESSFGEIVLRSASGSPEAEATA
jgi:segregation and condensation protein A